MELTKKDISLIKKALRICVVKFTYRGEKINDADSIILANLFQKVLEKIKY
jgi:hypothetical protein